MQLHTIKVFQKTSEIAQLRLLSSEGKLIGERELSLAEVERFAAEVERKYRILPYDPGALPKLGQELYEWLDGPTTRWLAGVVNDPDGMTLRIDVAEKLRHLPWELLCKDASYLCFNPLHPFTPARLVSDAARKVDPQNRPLRTLFMACSAEDVQPLLAFETEEQMILDSARRHQIELFVEESGSLDGLRYQIEAFGRGYFDVFHLTGHADVTKKGPLFLMENNQGLRQDVSAEEIAEAFQGNWPRLVFLSGCKTGQSPEQGFLPSFCEALVSAGAPAVLGWALPVYDATANLAAGELYGHLAAGKSIDESVARTRLHLMRERVPDWHLLRLYVNATPLERMVTAPKTKSRARLMVREAASEFFDAGAKVEVCKREDFVGRRRAIQRCLRTLQSSQGDDHYVEGVLLRGMGGLGKSSLAARLCERMPGYKRIVFVGALDELGFITKVSDALGDPEAIGLLNQTGLSLTQRLRNLFTGPLSTQPILFVLDDFEQNLEASGGGYIAKSEPLEVLKSLLTAIREASSESRVIITSRYQFPLPSTIRLWEEPLETLRGGELAKKLTRLAAFSSSSSIEIDEDTRERARTLGAGNPRLLEWLNKILVDGETDATPIMDAMEAAAEKFREDILLRELLAQLPEECRRLIALASVYELPVDRQAIAAAVDGPINPHLERASSLGLVESGIDSATRESRYFVSRIALPLVEPEASAENRVEAEGRAARHLYQTVWKSEAVAGIEQELEIFRLAMAALEREIAAEVGERVARRWVNSNRYREAELLCRVAISLGEDHRLLLTLGRAQVVLGNTFEALQNYEKALSLCPDSDVKEKSGTLSNLAELVLQQGEVERALDLWQQSLALYEQIGNVQGKAATLHQMAGVIAQQGEVKRALDLWQQSLALKEQIGDVAGKAAALSNVAGVIAQQGDVKRALDLWQQSLAFKEQIGDVRSSAATLHNMAGVIAQQGEVKRALDLWQQSLVLYEQIGDVQGKAATLHQMAGVIAQQGDVKRALDLWQQSLAIDEQIGDVRGKAATLHNMAYMMAQQGDVKRALDLWQQSLALKEQIGDVRGKATTLSMIAQLFAVEGDFKLSLEHLNRSLVFFEQVGDVRGKSITLYDMGHLATMQRDFTEARRRYLEAGETSSIARSWPNMVLILTELGDLPIEDASGFLAQAIWLTIQIEAPPENTLNLIAQALHKLGVEHEIAPLLAATAFFIAQTRGQQHPEQEKLVQRGMNLLGACAEARNIESQEQFQEWYTGNGLNDPNRFLPALSSALEAMVSEEQWLFDRGLFKKQGE